MHVACMFHVTCNVFHACCMHVVTIDSMGHIIAQSASESWVLCMCMQILDVRISTILGRLQFECVCVCVCVCVRVRVY